MNECILTSLSAYSQSTNESVHERFASELFEQSNNSMKFRTLILHLGTHAQARLFTQRRNSILQMLQIWRKTNNFPSTHALCSAQSNVHSVPRYEVESYELWIFLNFAHSYMQSVALIPSSCYTRAPTHYVSGVHRHTQRTCKWNMRSFERWFWYREQNINEQRRSTFQPATVLSFVPRNLVVCWRKKFYHFIVGSALPSCLLPFPKW